MKTIKNGLLSMTLICCILISSTLSANNIVERQQHQQVKNEITKLVQNPELYKNGISCNEEISIKFSIDENGEIDLIGVKSNCTYLKKFVNEKLNNQIVNLDNYKPNQVYRVKLKFAIQ